MWLCILSTLFVHQTYADHLHGTFVVNALTEDAVYINNLYASIIPVRIPLAHIGTQVDVLEPGIIIHAHCNNNLVDLRNTTPTEVDRFNSDFEDFLARVLAYDPDFIDTIRSKYESSPVENYILKALLSNTVWSDALNNLTYNSASNTYQTYDFTDLCSNSIDNANIWGKEWFFLMTMGKDLTQWTTIISRKEWGADENISKPKPPSTGDTQSWSTSSWAGETVSTNQKIRQNYMTYFNTEDSKKAIMYTTNPDWRPLEYFPADRIIVHHTAGTYAANKTAWMQYMKSVHKYHGQTLWRGDIGYHFLIDGAGTIYEWRRWGMQSVWAHVLWHNRWSVGISMMSDSEYSVPMLVSLVKLSLYLGEQFNIDVTGTGLFKNPEVTKLEPWYALIAHKELTPLKPHDPDINMNVFRKILEKVKEQNPGLVQSIYK